MLLTLSTTHSPATDLGYLLHKHPERQFRADLSMGTAHVVWPLATPERATCALLVHVDPVALVRGRPGSPSDGPLAQYVNDRPYVANSLLSVAMGQVFRTAMNGRSKDRPELADQAIPLTATLSVLRCRGGQGMLRRLFEPLGYTVVAERLPLDPAHPEWGDSSLYRVTLTGTVRLHELLRHLVVLIPVLDGDKHYWVGQDEVDKLLARGEGWLAEHPERETIAHRYLKRRRSLARSALRQLAPQAPDDVPDTEGPEVALEKPLSLNQARIRRVVTLLRELDVKTVGDLGCGEGRILRALLQHRGFDRVVGMDVSPLALERAQARIERGRSDWVERLTLIQGSVTWRDTRIDGLDAAVLIEVIEHMELDRLPALEAALFGASRPGHVLVSTPNVEYNACFDMKPGTLRHPDHRWEWDRATFTAWALRVANEHGYTVQTEGIGTPHETLGHPTQMAIFAREGT
jgi:3' terminal RNA ribose 2'-O-methyltransferase Hen1